MSDVEAGLDRLADFFSWISVMPKYNGSNDPKFDGWKITMKSSSGACHYFSGNTLEDAVNGAVHTYIVKKLGPQERSDAPKKRKIKIKR